MPTIDINYMAIVIAVFVNFLFGYLWYTPLFGKAWAKEMGMDPTGKVPGGELAKGLIIMIIGNFLTAYVLSYDIAVWNPLTWGKEAIDASAAGMATMAAFFIWLGYYLPVDLSAIAWERKTWKLFAINTSYHFLQLLIAGMIITHM